MYPVCLQDLHQAVEPVQGCRYTLSATSDAATPRSEMLLATVWVLSVGKSLPPFKSTMKSFQPFAGMKGLMSPTRAPGRNRNIEVRERQIPSLGISNNQVTSGRGIEEVITHEEYQIELSWGKTLLAGSFSLISVHLKHTYNNKANINNRARMYNSFITFITKGIKNVSNL